LALWAGEFYSLLGVRPVLGRTLAGADDFRGCPLIAVVTYPFWQRELAGSAGAVGTAVSLNGHPYEVVGVTAPAFFGVEFGWNVPVWIPHCAERTVAGGGGTGGGGRVIGRLKPGVTLEQSRAMLPALSRAALEATVPSNAPAEAVSRHRNSTFGVEPFSSGIPFLGLDGTRVAVSPSKSWAS
jgi:putative ABC transport system permease protein